MKRIGILYDKESKKIFLLPEQVKALTAKGINVNIPTGLGNVLGIADSQYAAAGAKVFSQWKEVINASDIILKTNSFCKNELKQMANKIAITMSNYLANVDMLYYMLDNKVTGLDWSNLSNRSGYVFFPEIEEAKAPLILSYVKDALAKGLAKRQKDKVTYPANPKMLILNATFAGIALAKLAIAAGFEVTIADSDSKYLTELKSSIKKLNTIDSGYETIVKEIKKANIFVSTAISPSETTRTRITKQMGQSMPKGSMMVDASCENGYAFQFIKRYATKDMEWVKLDNFYYLAPRDMTDSINKQVSEIISKKSVDYLMAVAEKAIDDPTIWKVAVCQYGKVLSANINSKLRLY